MASYQALFWFDLPSRVKAWDSFHEIRIELPPEIAARIDQAAQERGLAGADDWLRW